MRRVAEVIVVLRVFTSLFFLAPSRGAVVSRGQVCSTAGLGADSAERHQPLHLLRPAGRTLGCSAAGPFKMLKLLFTLEALILKNRHKASVRRIGKPIHI
ncbi:MAG TPA: hypothetical protein VGQ49_24830 [Bryobacteraceae bacterium]|nr:hypothetical protein [Bryobacteraceae bacterium]